jgi:hypothetical protein
MPGPLSLALGSQGPLVNRDLEILPNAYANMSTLSRWTLVLVRF